MRHTLRCVPECVLWVAHLNVLNKNYCSTNTFEWADDIGGGLSDATDLVQSEELDEWSGSDGPISEGEMVGTVVPRD